jgi:hypothetical protein
MGVSEQRDMRVLEKKIWWWADQNGTCHQQKIIVFFLNKI